MCDGPEGGRGLLGGQWVSVSRFLWVWVAGPRTPSLRAGGGGGRARALSEGCVLPRLVI